MASLEYLRNKIKSIDTTKKITKAMKLVATSNLRKEKVKFERSKDYIVDFYDIYRIISTGYQYKKIKENSPTLWVLVTSSFGLCGSFNIQLVKRYLEEAKENDRIFIIGKKGFSILKSKGKIKNISHFVNINPKDINSDIIRQLSKMIRNYMEKCEITKLNLIYTKFVNAITFNPIVYNVFPMKPDNKREYKNIKIQFQSDPAELMKGLEEQFLVTALGGAILESNVSENSCRRNTMDTASQNADTLKEKYLNIYNSTRQSKITDEINEIIGGSNGGSK